MSGLYHAISSLVNISPILKTAGLIKVLLVSDKNKQDVESDELLRRLENEANQFAQNIFTSDFFILLFL